MIKVKVLNYQNIYLIAPHNLAASIFNLLWFVYNSQLNLIVSQRMWWNSTRNCSYARVYLRSFISSWKTLERLYNVWFGTHCRIRRFRQNNWGFSFTQFLKKKHRSTYICVHGENFVQYSTISKYCAHF